MSTRIGATVRLGCGRFGGDELQALTKRIAKQPSDNAEARGLTLPIQRHRPGLRTDSGIDVHRN
jgi:hypothetical protein